MGAEVSCGLNIINNQCETVCHGLIIAVICALACILHDHMVVLACKAMFSAAKSLPSIAGGENGWSHHYLAAVSIDMD